MPFSVLGRGKTEIYFEAAVKTAYRGIPTLKGTLDDGKLGVIHKIAGVAETVMIHIAVKRNADDLLEYPGKVGIVVA